MPTVHGSDATAANYGSVENKENSLLAALVTGSEFRSNGINYVVVNRENGRENRRRSQLLMQASQPYAPTSVFAEGAATTNESVRQTLPTIAEHPQLQSTDWNSGSPMKRSEISIRELEFARSQTNSTE